MKMLDKTKYRIGILIAFFICLTIIMTLIDLRAGVIMLLASILLSWYYIGTQQRIKKNMDKLSDYLTRISNGDYGLDIRDNAEGELSILKNEIYKVTTRLREQNETIIKEKTFLSNSLADISHQLKTPLTSMFVMVDLLDNPKLDYEKRKETLVNLNKQLERIEWLVNSMLKFAKLDSESVKMNMEHLYVKDIIEQASAHLLIPMDLKNQSFEVNVPANAIIFGDNKWLKEALSNILKNCIEHTPSEGKLTVDFEDNALFSLLVISDNGCGICEEDLPFIFNRFYKGKNSSSDSVGIGLAMAYEIITRHGGTIEVKSTVGEGSTFIIKLYKMTV